MLKDGWADKLITGLLSVLLLVGGGLVGQAVWQWANSSQVQTYVDTSPLGDDLSQREMQLQRQSAQLIETLLAPADFRLAVLIDDTQFRARQLTLLVNRATPDEELEKSLQNILWAGLALQKERGDRVIVKSYAFAALNNGKAGVDAFRVRQLLLQRAIAGGVLLALVLLGFWFKRLQRGRENAALQRANDYQTQLLELKSMARHEPARVAGVLSAWLNDERL